MRSSHLNGFGLTLVSVGAVALSTLLVGGCSEDAEDPAVTPSTGGTAPGGAGGTGAAATGATGGSDVTGGTGGTGATGGTDVTGGTGGTDVTGGTGGTAGEPATTTGGAAGEGTGGGGAGEPGAFPGESCTGCARIVVPLAAAGDRCGFLLTLGETVDVSAATLTVRARAQAGDGGGLIIFARNGDPGYEREETWTNLNAMADWTDITLTFEAPTNPDFINTSVVAIGFQVMSGQTGPWPAESIIYIDSVTLTGASNSPFEFTADLEGLMLNANAECLAGSAVDWLGP